MCSLLRHFLTPLLFTTLGVASAQVQVDGSLVLEHNVTPGQQTVGGLLTLSNPADTAAEAQVTLSDIKSDPKLGTVYLRAGTLERSNTAWIELSSKVVTVPAHGKLTVPYQIKIPQNATPGTHWGLFLVSPTAPGQATANATKSGVSLRQVTQYAVQVVVNLPGGEARLKFQSPKLGKTAAGLTLDAELSNGGERLALPTTHAEIYDAQGQLVQKIEGRRRRVYPGLSVLETYLLSGLKPGKYQVLLLADDPNSDVVGARYNITVE